jgi:hypothetical protein
MMALGLYERKNEMKFTLIAEHETGEKITYEFENDYLYNVLDNVDLFLRGAGFVPEGTLAYTEEETYKFSDLSGMDNTMNTTADTVQHSDWYFDTGRNR